MNPGLRHRFREIVARWGPSPVRAPLVERFPHTTAVFTQYAAAHKGGIPPLCAVLADRAEADGVSANRRARRKETKLHGK